MKQTTTITKEDLRRALGIPPRYNLTSVTIKADGSVDVVSETSFPMTYQGKKHEETTEILRALIKAMSSNKEIRLHYDTDTTGTQKVSTRRFLPTNWLKENETIEGIDLELNEKRRFSVGKIEWIAEELP